MNHQTRKIHKCSQKQKRTAKTAISCLMLLLLYGCANQGQTVPAVTVLSDEADPSDPEDSNVFQQEHVAQGTPEAATETGDASGGQVASPDRAGALTVYVCGAVGHPGVYKLPANSRVYEAVELAGGMSEDAAPAAVNQAELLTDGQMIVIPTKEEEQVREEAEEAREEGLVNINTADIDELKTLPGIGDSKARSIVAYREKNGAFGTIDDIKNVEGIGDGVFAKLEDCIKVD